MAEQLPFVRSSFMLKHSQLPPKSLLLLHSAVAYEQSYLVLVMDETAEHFTLSHFSKEGQLIRNYSMPQYIHSFAMLSDSVLVAPNRENKSLEFVDLRTHKVTET
jgi:hypothetical protein